MAESQNIKSRREVLQSALRGAGLLGIVAASWGITAKKMKAPMSMIRVKMLNGNLKA